MEVEPPCASIRPPMSTSSKESRRTTQTISKHSSTKTSMFESSVVIGVGVALISNTQPDIVLAMENMIVQLDE